MNVHSSAITGLRGSPGGGEGGGPSSFPFSSFLGEAPAGLLYFGESPTSPHNELLKPQRESNRQKPNNRLHVVQGIHSQLAKKEIIKSLTTLPRYNTFLSISHTVLYFVLLLHD